MCVSRPARPNQQLTSPSSPHQREVLLGGGVLPGAIVNLCEQQPPPYPPQRPFPGQLNFGGNTITSLVWKAAIGFLVFGGVVLMLYFLYYALEVETRSLRCAAWATPAHEASDTPVSIQIDVFFF
jgi:hypothetical protein